MRKFYLGLVFALFALPHAGVSATKTLVAEQDWQAFQFKQNTQNTCYATSKPKVSEGQYTKRGDVLVFVSHFADADPNTRIFDQISVNMGYPVKKGEGVQLKVANSDYLLRVSAHDDDRSTVYAEPDDEKKLIRAFKKGYEFELRGISSRGTKTYDKFSLRGFSKAYAAIEKGCR